MRVFGHVLGIVCLAAAVLTHAGAAPQATPPPAPPQAAEKAAQVLAAARAALGGDQKLSAVQTFVATGRTRQVRGDNLVPIEFEIDCALPDKYVRKDEIPAQESGPTSTGFNGDDLIQVPPPPSSPAAPARPGGPPPPTPQQLRAPRVAAAKQDFARLTLGMFAASFAAYPLSFTYAGQAEAPQGKADAIDAKGPANFVLRLFVNSETHLPIMVSWRLPPTNVIFTVPGQPAPASVSPGAVVAEGPAPPSADASKEEKDKYTKDLADARKKAMATLVEYRLYYGDYRPSDGLQFPFRLRRAIGTDTVEETTFDQFKVNAKIDPRKFEAIK